MRVLHVAAMLACAGPAGCGLAENYTDPSGPRFEGAYAADLEARADLPRTRIVSFNIKFSRAIDRAIVALETRPDLAGADVLVLQEMDAPGTDAIAQALGLNYVYYPGSTQHGKDFGNAVLSRWPIVDDEKVILPHENPYDGRIRIAVRATVRTPVGDVQAYSVHNETPWLGPRARLEQAVAIVEHAKRSAVPVVAAGDYNTSDPGALDAVVERFEAEGFTWASRDSGDTAGGLTLDSTFTRGFDPLGSGVVDTDASDHRPLWVQARFAP